MVNPTEEEIAKVIQSASTATGGAVKTVNDLRFEAFEKRLAELEKTNAELRQANAELYAFAQSSRQAQAQPQPAVVQTVTTGEIGTTVPPQSIQYVSAMPVTDPAVQARIEAQKAHDDALLKGTLREMGAVNKFAQNDKDGM